MAVRIKQTIKKLANSKNSKAKYKLKYSYTNTLKGTSTKQTQKYSYSKKIVAKNKYSYKRG